MRTQVLTKLIFSLFFGICGCCYEEKEYYSEEKIKKEVRYCFFEKDSLVEKYYKNGNLLSIKRYKNGNTVDTAKKFYKNGQLKAKVFYRNGKRSGIGTLYHENGKVMQTQEFQNGIRRGLTKSFYKNGKLKGRELVENDSTRLFFDLYSEEGEFVREMRKFKVSHQFDTVHLGDTHTFSVKPYGPVDRYKKLIAKLYLENIYQDEIKEDWLFKLGENYDKNFFFLHVFDENENPVRKDTIHPHDVLKKTNPTDNPTFEFSYKPKETGKYSLIGVYNFISRTNEETDVNNPEGIGKMFFAKFYVEPAR